MRSFSSPLPLLDHPDRGVALALPLVADFYDVAAYRRRARDVAAISENNRTAARRSLERYGVDSGG